MRAYEKEPVNKVFGEPEIVELGLDDDGNKQWFIATREGFQEVGENGVLQLDNQHFAVGSRITLEEPIEEPAPCRVCGNEERGQGGYLSCECPASRADIPSDVLASAWSALFGENIVRTPQRKLLVLACARLAMAERIRKVPCDLINEARDFTERMTSQPWACELIERLLAASGVTKPHPQEADGEDLSHDFEAHDCGEDTCVCAEPDA